MRPALCRTRWRPTVDQYQVLLSKNTMVWVGHRKLSRMDDGPRMNIGCLLPMSISAGWHNVSTYTSSHTTILPVKQNPLASARKRYNDVVMARTVHLGVRVSPDIKEALAEIASAEDRKLAALVEEALRRWLKGRDVKEEGT